MSAIDPINPLDTLAVASSDQEERAERLWLYDLWQKWKVRHSDGTSANDPGTCTPVYLVPFAAPGCPVTGNFYFQSSGLVYMYDSGPTARLSGTMPKATRLTLRALTTLTGWTRDTSLVDDSVLRYTTGTPGAGGTVSIAGTMDHTPQALLNSVGASALQRWNVHPSLLYVDVLFSTKDS